MGDPDGPSQPPLRGARVLSVAKAGWVYVVGLTVAVVFLALGNTTGRIIGGALLIALALLVSRVLVRRNSDASFAVSVRTALIVYGLYAVVALSAIGAGIYGFVSGGETVIASAALIAGVYGVLDARKHLRLVRTRVTQGAEPIPPAE